ncbi:ras-GEF domain-containing family member 1B-like [Planococcus citri]|uniref:ras-GEF domain-containing family member 1B-like n=1 Tax=Planococcus citri TaxID=170843 RepID=UPI0031FA4672
MDDEIQETVEAILGKDVKVIDCEKKSTIKEEEVLLINGCPVTLDGEDGAAVKEALLRGNIPNCHSLNQILVRVGILKAPVKLETNLSVKSNVVTREEVTVAKGGQVVDERSRETKEDNFYTSNTSEIWEPVGIISNDNLSSIDSTSKDFSSLLCTPIAHSKDTQPSSIKSACNSNNSPKNGSDSSREPCSRHDAPKKYQETKMVSVSKKFSSDSEDKTDFVYSSDTVSGASLKDASAVHVLPLGLATKNKTNGSDSSSSSSSGLVFRDGTLVSGSLEMLIRHLIPSTDYYPDKEFIFAFLLTSRLFVKPDELLDKIVCFCDIERNFNNKHPENKEQLTQFIPRLVQLLGDWIESFPYDFRDDKLMAHVQAIMQKCVNINPDLLPEVSTLVRNLLERLTNLEHYEEFLQEFNQNSVKQSVEILPPVNVVELCAEPKILAQQLCHIELERLSYIGPEEFVEAFVQEHASGADKYTRAKKTCNLESYVQWFNRLSYVVGSEICKHVKKKSRIKTVEYWVEVARESFNIGNFNSLMAIIAGLNLSPVARLKKTWAKVQSAKFSILEHQMNPTSNFSSYRSTLKAAMWRSTGNNVQHQCLVIPFFSLLIKDIYFLNEGCSDRLPNGHVNFEKFWQLSQQVSEFVKWKQTACPFEKNLHIITFLQASPVLSEKALLLASFECEPPENSLEKEQYKHIKNGDA